MGDLTNKQISATYDGLIKTNDEQPIDGNLKTLQDGVGNNLPMEVSTTGVNFTGTVTGTPNDNTTYTLDKTYFGTALIIELNGSDASQNTVGFSPGTGIDFVPTTAGIQIAASGGGGSSNSIVITTGTIDTWAGPAGQDVIVSQATIPANTITGAATIQFYSPVDDGSEGQWNYTSFQIAPTAGSLEHINVLGQQSSTGGGDPYVWQRMINVASNGDAYWKDHNAYSWPGSGGDPIAQNTNVDWTVDNYFTVTAWCDASNATFRVYSPTLTIVNA